MITRVQSKSGAITAGVTLTVVLDQPPSVGNRLVAIVHNRGLTTPTMSGFDLDAQQGTGPCLSVFSRQVQSGDGSSYSSVLGVGAHHSMIIIEYTGVASATPVDQIVTKTVASVNSIATGPTGITADSVQLVIAAVGLSGGSGDWSGVWSNSFNDIASVESQASTAASSLSSADYVTTNTQPYDTTTSWTTARNTQTAMVTYRSDSSGLGRPVADAGVDQVVSASQLVSLDGSASYDNDGMIATYTWRQISGPNSVILDDATLSGPTFTAPNDEGEYVFGLSVEDDQANTSYEDSVRVTVAGAVTTLPSKKVKIGDTWVQKPLRRRSSGAWIT